MTGDTGTHARLHRSLFMSDLHLGAPGCKAELILDFLQHNDAETIYLVGDTFDLWDPLIIYWGTAHQQIVALLRDRMAAGRSVIFLAGNHDRALLGDKGKSHPDIEGLADKVLQETVHLSGDGLRYLVLHGDACDSRFLRFHIWTRIGSRVDSFLRLMDSGLRMFRIRFGAEAKGPMELAILALNAVLYRNRQHEKRLAAMARAGGYDGVICGHFHIATLHDDHGTRYANCGDWTDTCSALVEYWDGSLALIGARAAADVPQGKPSVEGY